MKENKLLSEDYKITLGKRVKMYRERRNLSQEELSKMLGYSHKTSISNIEAGKANVPSDKLFQFATVLNCTVDDLLGTNTEFEDTQVKAEELANEMQSMQKILTMLSKMDAKKLNKVATILQTMFEE